MEFVGGTALVRRSVRTAPMHAFRAPTMRSGKTMLADTVSILATGRPCAVMSQAFRPEDESKRLLAVLLAGDPVVCYDNIDRPFGGAAISQALTQESITDRVLGLSKSATVPTAATFLATGNNLTFEGDITCRVLTCDLDAKMEHPEHREFRRDLYKDLPRDRAKLVPAGLTVLRAYHVAGRPDQKLSRWAGFDEWSDWIRSAIVWCGMPDPCLTRSRIEEQDPVRRILSALLNAWSEAFGQESVTVADVVKEAGSPGSSQPLTTGQAQLRDALLDAAGRRGVINTRALGNYLQAHAMRIEGGMWIERVGNRSGVAVWRVVRTKGVA